MQQRNQKKFVKRERTNEPSTNRRNQTKRHSHLNNKGNSYSNVNNQPSVNFPCLDTPNGTGTNNTSSGTNNTSSGTNNTSSGISKRISNTGTNNVDIKMNVDYNILQNEYQTKFDNRVNTESLQQTNVQPTQQIVFSQQANAQQFPLQESKQEDEIYYNPNNRLLTKDFVELTLFNVIGQKFCIHNLHFYQTAFVHASAYKKNIAPPHSREPLVFLQTYESLEFMGDSWLGAIVTDYLYHRFPGQKEGFLTKVRAKIVREQQLIKFSEQLNFHRYVILPIKAEKMLGRKGAKFLEDVFEAFCAALIEDLGVEVLQLFIKHMLERNVDFNDLILFDDDYKSMLLQFHQRHGWPHPTYRMIDQEGPGHKKQFVMGVDYIEEFDNIDNLEKPLEFQLFNIKTKNKNGEEQYNECKIFVTGKGKSKKEAEQAASKEALETFGMIV